MYSDNQFLIPYLGNISHRKRFSGWYREKISRRGRHEFYLITRGNGKFTAEGETYSVGVGDLIYIPAKDGMRYNLFPGEDLIDYYAVNFPCAVVSHVSETWLFDEKNLYHYLSSVDDEREEWALECDCGEFELAVVSSPPDSKTLRNILSQLYQLRQKAETVNLWQEKILLQQFLCEIASQNRQYEKEDMNTYRIRTLLIYIENHYMEPLTLETLCSVVGLSPSYVTMLFKQYTKRSPMAYVNLIRMEAAKEMLLESALPVSEIASMTGFQDAFYFSRKFKQILGCTPRQYRSQTSD